MRAVRYPRNFNFVGAGEAANETGGEACNKSAINNVPMYRATWFVPCGMAISLIGIIGV